MDALDIIKDISEEELLEELPEPKWKKPLLLLIGFFLLTLIVSLSFSYYVSNIITSEQTTNNVLMFKNETVTFEGNTLKLLQQHYLDNEHREIKACLYGIKEYTNYRVTKIEFPRVIDASVHHVRAIPCPINTLIDLHSHPINSCLASEHDVTIYNEFRKPSNPDLRIMIMCSKNRFAIV
jgi:hypothetical protein